MNEEHDGTNQGKPSEEEYQRFRKMIDGVGREGLQRMVEHLTERIEANPRDTEALGGRGLAYAELGDHRRSAEDNGRIIALEPDNAGAYLDRARAYSAMEEHRLAPGDAVTHYSRGACKAELGDLAGAMSDFDAAIELEERFGLAFYARGITNVNLGAHEAALGDFDAALGLDPDNASALRGRGVALGSLGRYDEAVRDFDRSLELDPGNAETLAARGAAHTSLEQHELAIEDYSRVINLDPRNRDVLYSRGIARMYAARFESAVEDFEAIIGIEPGNGAARAARGLAREALGAQGGEGQAAR